MTQLIINGTEYPKTSNDKYKCYKKEIGKSLRMAAGNMVTEVRGKYTIIEYSYDYFEPDLMKKCLVDLRSGLELNVTYLETGEKELSSGMFRCTNLPEPSFAFSRGDKAYWHNVSFVLEAVECD